MSCRDTIHLICWYLEGKLSEAVERDVEQHLNHCSDCSIILEVASTTLDQYFNLSNAARISHTPQVA